MEPSLFPPNPAHRVVRAGAAASPTIFTIGYEKRSGADLIADLQHAGVRYLADIREKPFSHKPDFRMKALKARCEGAGIAYTSWPSLGSTQAQRDAMKESGDAAGFFRAFRKHATSTMATPLDQLAEIARTTPIALLCYERAHDECHRSVIAEMLADRLNAGITAIL